MNKKLSKTIVKIFCLQFNYLLLHSMDNNTNSSDLSAMSNIQWKATPTVTQTALFFTLAAITLLGNGLVVIAVIKDPFKELRTIPNYLVVNLAIADLLLGLIAEPLWGMALWVRSAQYEVAAMTVILTSTMATNLTVTALSAERYVYNIYLHLVPYNRKFENTKEGIDKLISVGYL